MSSLFPKQADNAYRGYRIAILLLALATLMRLGMSGQMLFNTQFAAQTADGIALAKFGTAGTTAFLMIFKLLGWDFMLLNVLSAGVLIRYRSLIPLMFLLQLVEQFGRRALVLANPIERTGVSVLPFNINYVLLALLAMGFVLSLIPRKRSVPAAAV